MTAVRLIADDLTGALDTAVPFAHLGGAIPVYWSPTLAVPASGSLAADAGTRGAGSEVARRTVAGLARSLPAGTDALLYCKLDSLLRGHGAAEIAGWMDAVAPERCIIAPAFPHHGRVTREGIQYLRRDGAETAVGGSLAADLRQLGFEVRLCRRGDAIPGGVSLWDAECDADLADLVAAVRRDDGGHPRSRTLWCGSGGLAIALAGGATANAALPIDLPRPILGLFGSDHPVTRAQIAACGTAAIGLPDGGASSLRQLTRKLAAEGAALVWLDLPEGLGREEAASRIAHEFARLVDGIDPPGTLVVAGGETLRGLCRELDAERLDVYGQIETGVPCSILRGGRFDRVHVVSKSGAFGDAGLLRRLLFSSQGDHA